MGKFSSILVDPGKIPPNLSVVRPGAIESWDDLIWLKRISPLLVAAVLWFGYSFWSDYRDARNQAEDERLSLAVAKIWIATALYRDNPARYAEFRDSVLNANDLTQDDLFDYVRKYNGEEEEILSFTQMVKHKVDSLYVLEIQRIDREEAMKDSLTSKPPSKL